MTTIEGVDVTKTTSNRAEAKGPAEVRDLFTTGTLCGRPIRIKKYMDWTSRAVQAQVRGDYESWAADCLAGDDYARVWVPASPTIGDIYEFFDTWSIDTEAGDDAQAGE
jgi:hypothetical protein